MRFRNLSMIRYGHFDGTDLDFGSDGPDLHLVIGPNEAGKSTVLAGVSDVLFGFEARTQFGFLHDAKELRLGATIVQGEETLSFLRRKGNKSTILSVDDEAALPDSVLTPFLGAGDRQLFERMFGLNHVRLREGGEAILEAQDDIGKLLFEAGSGVAGLGQHLATLDEEADQIFKPRGSKQELNRGLTDLREARGRSREAMNSAKEWQAAVDDLAELESSYQESSDRRQSILVEQSRLERVRRVRPLLSKLDGCRTELMNLGDLPSLPPEFPEEFGDAERNIRDVQTRIDECPSSYKLEQSAA